MSAAGFFRRTSEAEWALTFHVTSAMMARKWRTKAAASENPEVRAQCINFARQSAMEARREWAQFLKLKSEQKERTAA